VKKISLPIEVTNFLPLKAALISNGPPPQGKFYFFPETRRALKKI
jgi:hypothetical protein